MQTGLSYVLEPNRLRYDLFQPKTAGPHPLIVCCHGGGWITGGKEDLHPVANEFTKLGYAAVCVDYRLAPLHPFPAAVEDLEAFMHHFRENAKELNILPDRIASFGSSAGGHLAAMLATTSDPKARVKACVNLCGLMDITEPLTRHFPISWSFISQFMGDEPYEGNEAKYRAASPLYHVTKDSAPMLIFHGEDDEVVPIQQSIDMVAAYGAVGVPCRFISLPKEGHGFTMEAWPTVLSATEKFLSEYL
ncbi:MAG: alpha/beta hydrolase [Armatimonadetes bacterium]|nr:alpha/beta hydrolase [Armatimonadota bacterium]